MEKELIALAAEYIRDSGLLLPNVLEDFNAGKINCSEEPYGALYWATKEQIETIQKIEQSGHLKVWHIIKGTYEMSDGDLWSLETYLVVFSEYKKKKLTDGTFLVHAYARNLSWGVNEYGDVLIQPNNGGLKRLI